MRRLLAVLLGYVLCSVLLGCGPYAPRSFPIVWDDDDGVGTWVHEADDTSAGAMIRFDADGAMHYEGLPIQALAMGGPGCNDVIAESTMLISGEGTWEWMDDRYIVDFPDESRFTYVWPAGFFSFDRLEFVCDPDSAASYLLVRQDDASASVD